MDILGYVITAAVGVLGVAVAWGTMTAITKRNMADITKLDNKVDTMDDKFVPQTECVLRHDNVADTLDEVKSDVSRQEHTTRRLLNFATYQLMVKDGIPLAEANEILENGKK